MAAPQQRLDVLHTRLAELELTNRISSLQEEVRVRELTAALISAVPEDDWSWGAWVDRREALYDTPGWAPTNRVSMAADRRNGDNLPFWSTEIEQAAVRGIGRFLAGSDELSVAALNNLCNYTVGKGVSYEFAPKEDSDSAETQELAKRCQTVVETFVDTNQWYGDGDRHGVERNHRDGELLITLNWRGGLDVEARFCCPSFLTEPDNTRSLETYLGVGALDWKYGIASDWNNPTRVHGYFVLWSGDDNDWEFVPPDRMLHLKLNVDREVKRGCSDYYIPFRNLERAGKLLGNTVHGAAVQAAIAYIREHAPGTGNQKIADWVGARATQTVTTTYPGGKTQDRKMRKAEAGTVVDTPAGVKYHAGPMGQQRSQSYVDVLQAVYRVCGIRWTMPEYMISGDASNANFSSTLVAESPYVVNSENRQAYYGRGYSALLWKVCDLVHRHTGYIPLPSRQLRRVLTLTPTFPRIAVRDRLKEAQASEIEQRAGILSRDTWAAQAGYKLKDEEAKGAEPAPVMLPGMGGGNQPPTRPNSPAVESIPVADRVNIAKGLLWGTYP